MPLWSDRSRAYAWAMPALARSIAVAPGPRAPWPPLTRIAPPPQGSPFARLLSRGPYHARGACCVKPKRLRQWRGAVWSERRTGGSADGLVGPHVQLCQSRRSDVRNITFSSAATGRCACAGSIGDRACTDTRMRRCWRIRILRYSSGDGLNQTPIRHAHPGLV